MEYISVKEASQLWDIDISRIGKLLRSGKIPGATRISGHWVIPKGTAKPLDGRTKAAALGFKPTVDTFRYPAFEYCDSSSFIPPLCEGEIRLKTAFEAFYSCDFKEADVILGEMPENEKNRYLHFAALYAGCMTDIFLCNINRFVKRYDMLVAGLQEDFPHKPEMNEYLHEINATLGEAKYYIEKFEVRPDYNYHESFYPQLAMLNSIVLFYPNVKFTDADLKAHEINVKILENRGPSVALQTLHLYLGIAYYFLGCGDAQNYHIKQALLFAEKYDSFYPIALQY